MDIARRLRCTRASMIGTADEQHYFDCHEAADEIDRLRTTIRQVLVDAESQDVLNEWWPMLQDALTHNVKVSGAGTASAGLPG